jgi:Tol biopolymer transport system component
VKEVGGAWGFARDVHWLPDGRSFLAVAVDLSGLAAPQIWRVEYPSGERTRFTNDLNGYRGVSLSADGRSLVTVQSETVAGIYVADGADREPREISGGSARADGLSGLAWTGDGRIVYTSSASGLTQLWIVDADGKNARQLTTLPGPASLPRTGADGAWIYFTAYGKDGNCLFRMAPDGSGLKQLTTGVDARKPIPAPDAKTLYFTTLKSGTPHVMKVAAGGGTPEPVVTAYFQANDISPDGTRLLGVAWSEQLRRAVLATYTLADGRMEHLPGFPNNAQFMPDGALTGVQRIQGKSIIGFWPSGGGRFTPMAPPHPHNVFSGAISRDRRVVFSRGLSTNDVVLITAKQDK